MVAERTVVPTADLRQAAIHNLSLFNTKPLNQFTV